MRKQAKASYEEDDVIDGDTLRRGKVKKKNNLNASVNKVVTGLGEVSNEVDEFRRIIDRSGRPQVEVLEEDRVLGDDAGFAETARYYYENVKDKAKNAWDEVAKPFRESKQMKKELKAQENLVNRKIGAVRQDANRALGEIALESHREIQEMNKLNEYKEEQYKLRERQKDKELEAEIRKHEIEMQEINERFEKERAERKREIKSQIKQAKKEGDKTDKSDKQPSRFESAYVFSTSVSRYSMLSKFHVEGFYGEGDGFGEEVEESIDVNAEMKVLLEVMARSKLERLNNGVRILFHDHDDAIAFCSVFNKVVYPLGIGDYKFSDFNSGMGETSDYYSVNIDGKELEVIDSFNKKSAAVNDADCLKKF